MNITSFIDHLNKTKGWNLDSSYYTYINEWKDWWKGYYPPFHLIHEMGLDGSMCSRQMSRMKMPKRACEDWASLLLNDKTTVTIQDAASARWLLGEDGQQSGGELGRLEFWPHANALVEQAFRSGTGAFVIGVEGLTVQHGEAVQSPQAQLYLDCLPAECILPIATRHGQVEDVAFVSEVISGGASRVYLQTHQMVQRGGSRQYRITNEYFESKDTGEGVGYQPAPLPAGMAESITTGSGIPWFSLFSPNIVKNIDGGQGLGMAVFSEALDQAKQCDLAFDNYSRDIFLGGKKVFYNKNLLRSRVDANGGIHWIPPDSLRQQLFVHTEGHDPDAEPDWHEYNPDLRVDANSRAVQDALDYFSFKVGLGTHHYQFNAGSIATATQYTGERQDMVQHANRHQIKIEAALIRIFRAMLWAGRTLLGAAVDPDTPVTINFDDSYIADTATRRAQDKDDALSGFIPKYRYNMEWRGMSEEEARRAVQEAESEAGSAALSFGGEF